MRRCIAARYRRCSVGIAIAATVGVACQKADPRADEIETSHKPCTVDTDCEYEHQVCASSGARAGTCTPALCAGANDCMPGEECVAQADEQLGICVTSLHDGSACTTEEEQQLACGESAEGERDGSVLACEGGVWTGVTACPAGEACALVTSQTSIACGAAGSETAYAFLGWRCAAEQSAACTFDQGTLLICSAGTWIAYEACAVGLRCHEITSGDSGISCGTSPTCLACAG
jgi:hypothetical protein